MAENNTIERAMVLNAFNALYPNIVRLADMPKLLDEIERLGEEGLDRFDMLARLLEARGLATETRKTWRYMATLQRRHAEARARVNKLAPRTDGNAVQFDEAHATEIALNNSILAAFEDAEADLTSVLAMAGLPQAEAEALLSLRPDQRLRYEESDEHAKAYGELIGWDLAHNISSQFSGGSLGIRLSAAGEVVWRLVMGVRVLPGRTAA